MSTNLALRTFALTAAFAATAATQDIPLEVILSDFDPGDFTSDKSASRGLIMGDFNGDDLLDVFVANFNLQDNELFLNDGNGGFTKVTDGPLVNDGSHSRGAAAGDIDNDGDLDIFVANGGSEVNSLWINQGGTQGGTEGEFLPITSGDITEDMAFSRNAAFADIDGDGDLDLFVANTGNEDNFLYRNENGEFVRVTAGPVVSDGGVSHEGVFGDVDGDGDIDLFVPNGSGVVGGQGAVNFLYLNDGNGNFTRATQGNALTAVFNTKCGSLGDWDGDGDLDLFTGNNQGQKNRLYENDGNGVFTDTDHPDLTEDRGETNDAEWADMDNDGRLDLVLVNAPGLAGFLADVNLIYYNDGNGRFDRPTFGPLTEDRNYSFQLGLGDIDGDGNLDMLVANDNEGNSGYFNRGPQWVDLEESLAGGSGTPLQGASGNLTANTSVELDVTAAALNAPATLVLGFDLLLAPFAGGTLVPTPDVLAARTTNALGETNLRSNVPAGIPSALDLYFQWWIQDAGAPEGLAATNALRATTP